MNRTAISQKLRREVLTEAGFRCAVPTCRQILALDLHHIIPVENNGPNTLFNLIALCPTCHALHTRGTIPQESIWSWKTILVSLNAAFDRQTIDDLLFLSKVPDNSLGISGDGVLRFSRLIGADLATFTLISQNGILLLYKVLLTQKGKQLVDAWYSGSRSTVEQVLSGQKV